MTTVTFIPQQRVAQRSVVQKTFVDALLLSGFTDASHFELLCNEYLATLPEEAATTHRLNADLARAVVSGFAVRDPAWHSNVIHEPILGPHIAAIQSDPVFQQTFGALPYQFAHVDLLKLIALQPWVEPRRDPVPTDESELLDFCLPRKWDVPAEISITPTNGIQVLSSDPALSGLKIDFDHLSGKVTLSPPQHPNLVQVSIFNGRAYLRNGYHRVVDALSQGLKTLPALVVHQFSPEQLALPSAGCFSVHHVLGLQRPPLVNDFLGAAATPIKVRERRYGLLISFDVKPFNIGV